MADTSPDVSEYVDLTLHDVTVQDLIDAALADAQAKLPSWVPREGHTEVVLLESLALVVAELAFAINRVPGAVTEALLGLYGLTRDAGTAPSGTATFALSDTLGHTIPRGTRLRLDLGSGADPVDFTTDDDLVVPSGSSSGTVAVTGTEATSRANGTASGTALELIDAVPYVNGVTLAAALSAGTDPETGDAFLDRGSERLRRLVETLVVPEHFTRRALEEPAVYRATTLDNYDPGQAGAVGDHPGHVTVAVSGTDGAPIAAATKTSLETAMEEAAQANLDVHIADPTVTAVAVTVTVVRKAGYTDAQVTSNVQATLTAYLNPNSWEWAGTVYRNELLAVIDGAEGVARVVTLDAPAADAALAGVAPLATAGTITVTVQAP